MGNLIRRVVGTALAVSALGLAVQTVDYIGDAPLRAQYESCTAGSLCEGLVTD